MFVFRKIWRALLSCYLRFEIRPFALLPTALFRSLSKTKKRNNLCKIRSLNSLDLAILYINRKNQKQYLLNFQLKQVFLSTHSVTNTMLLRSETLIYYI